MQKARTKVQTIQTLPKHDLIFLNNILFFLIFKKSIKLELYHFLFFRKIYKFFFS